MKEIVFSLHPKHPISSSNLNFSLEIEGSGLQPVEVGRKVTIPYEKGLYKLILRSNSSLNPFWEMYAEIVEETRQWWADFWRVDPEGLSDPTKVVLVEVKG